jgi:hypothetical protein
MAMTTVITTLCLAGIAFNVRFLLALCHERKALFNESGIRKHGG